MDKFLVDSDIVIWYLNNREKEVKLLKELSMRGKLFFPVVTIAEVRAGLTKRAHDVISELKNIFEPVNLTPETAALAGEFKQKYRLDIADMFIAATAVCEDFILVTYNKKHYPMPEIKLFEF